MRSKALVGTLVALATLGLVAVGGVYFGFAGASGLPPAHPTTATIAAVTLGGPLTRPVPRVIAEVNDPRTVAEMYQLLRTLPAPPKPAPSCPAMPNGAYQVTFFESARMIVTARLVPGACRIVFLSSGRVLWASSLRGSALFGLVAKVLGTSQVGP